MTKLFYYPHAPYSRKVLFAAYEKRVSFERAVCKPFEPADKAALRAVHPLATVPLLVTDDGVWTESSVIVEYFGLVSAEGPKLIPDDPREALQVRALDRLADAHLMGPTAYLGWALRKPPETQNLEKIAGQRRALETALGLLEERLARHAWVSGADVGFADCSPVGALSSALFDGTLKDLTPWPAVTRWYERIVERPSFRAVLEDCRSVDLPPGFG